MKIVGCLIWLVVDGRAQININQIVLIVLTLNKVSLARFIEHCIHVMRHILKLNSFACLLGRLCANIKARCVLL